MEKKDNGERWAAVLQDDDQEEEEDALSLCDLPLIHHPRKNSEEEEEDKNHKIKCSSHRENQIQEQDFDFCSVFGESEMCAADDVFFQGQILPLHRSISYEQHRNFSTCRSMSRSESMFHSRKYYYSSSSSSRSSSLNSNSSSSSLTSTVSNVPNKQCYIKPKLPPRNQFQYYSHPSPSPRLCNRRGGTLNGSSVYTKSHPKKPVLPSSSSAWNIFKLGLVKTPPEILNARPCSNNFGSRNSASSNGSASDKKKKQRVGLFGSCKCSSSSVDDSRARVVVVREMKSRSATEGGVKALMFDEDESRVEMMMLRSSKAKKKKQMSHHRTFQWLKQLSIEGAAADNDHDHDIKFN